MLTKNFENAIFEVASAMRPRRQKCLASRFVEPFFDIRLTTPDYACRTIVRKVLLSAFYEKSTFLSHLQGVDFLHPTFCPTKFLFFFSTILIFVPHFCILQAVCGLYVGRFQDIKKGGIPSLGYRPLS
jgi:hypothetical protein